MKYFIIQETKKDKIHQWVDATLSDLLGNSVHQMDFEYHPYGKPFLKDNPVYFNLSHSEEYAILVVSTIPVGVDIEKVRDNFETSKIVNRFFCENEKDLVGNNLEKFFEYWVRKESLIKAVGKGLGMGLDNLDVTEDLVSYENEKWHIQNLHLSFSGYKAAVCQKCF